MATIDINLTFISQQERTIKNNSYNYTYKKLDLPELKSLILNLYKSSYSSYGRFPKAIFGFLTKKIDKAIKEKKDDISIEDSEKICTVDISYNSSLTQDELYSIKSKEFIEVKKTPVRKDGKDEIVKSKVIKKVPRKEIKIKDQMLSFAYDMTKIKEELEKAKKVFNQEEDSEKSSSPESEEDVVEKQIKKKITKKTRKISSSQSEESSHSENDDSSQSEDE